LTYSREVLDIFERSYETEKQKGKLEDYDDLFNQATKKEPKDRDACRKLLTELMKKAGYSDKATKDYVDNR